MTDRPDTSPTGVPEEPQDDPEARWDQVHLLLHPEDLNWEIQPQPQEEEEETTAPEHPRRLSQELPQAWCQGCTESLQLEWVGTQRRERERGRGKKTAEEWMNDIHRRVGEAKAAAVMGKPLFQRQMPTAGSACSTSRSGVPSVTHTPTNPPAALPLGGDDIIPPDLQGRISWFDGCVRNFEIPLQGRRKEGRKAEE